MPPEVTGHPEAAAWALGALDAAEAESFRAHLQSCGGCRIAVADFEQVTRALAHPPPAIEPLGAAAVAIVFVLVQVVQTAPAQAQTVIPLHAASVSAASGQATAVHSDSGWSIRLTVNHLPPLGPGQFYECWYAGPGNRPGHPELITAGTFLIGPGGTGSFTMWSAADPQVFKTMQITVERPGDAGQHGQVILSGTARRS